MKRLVILIVLAFWAISGCAQQAYDFGQNIRIKKKDPRLYFNNNAWIGTYGNFSSTLYLNAAPRVGSDTLATRSYSRTYGGTGSMTYPGGSGIPIVVTGTSWGTTITNNSTNWNTAYSWGNHASAGYAPLASPIFTTSVTFPTTITIGATLLLPSITELNYVDGVTSNIQDQFGGKADTTGVQFSDICLLLTDTVPEYTFMAGIGLDADSTLFAKGADHFGCFHVETDSLKVPYVRQIKISEGDSLLFNLYYGNYQTGVIVDSLFTSPQASGENQTTFVPDNVTTIPHGYGIWPGLYSDQITGYRPKEWIIQLNKQVIRD